MLLQQVSPVVEKSVDPIILGFQNINLGPIVFKLTDLEEGKGWSLEKANRHVEEFKFFFYMHYKFPNHSFVPTKEIDEVWHCLIQDTKLYRILCQHHLGRFLDHFPYLGTRGVEDKLLLESMFEETKHIFAEHFSAFVNHSAEIKMFQNAACNGCNSHCGRCSGDISSEQTLSELYLVRPTV